MITCNIHIEENGSVVTYGLDDVANIGVLMFDLGWSTARFGVHEKKKDKEFSTNTDIFLDELMKSPGGGYIIRSRIRGYVDHDIRLKWAGTIWEVSTQDNRIPGEPHDS